MNLGELRSDFRGRVCDTKKPYLWSDREVDGYINEALIEAVDRGLMIYDRESFTVDVAVGVTDYALDKSIIRVNAALVTSKDGVALDEPELLRLAERESGFVYHQQFGRHHDLQGYRIDEDGTFVLDATPSTVATLSLEVYRYADALQDDSDEPEIPNKYHAKMLDWALKLAYLKQDADTYDPSAAERHDAEFARTFGTPKTAQQHRQRLRRAARSIKTPWF